MSDVLHLLCFNACLYYRGVLYYRTLSSCTSGSPVTNSVWVDLQFTPKLLNNALKLWFRTSSNQLFPLLYVLQSIDDN